MLKEKNIAYSLIGIFAILLYTLAVLTDGTGDSGDSVMHYFFSKYAFVHPENFVNHWAKPVFVLLSAPFAQFGFVGMKVFNCTVALLTAFFVFKTCLALGIKNSWLSVLFLFFSVKYFILIFSGLTEPLFALLLISAIYFSINKKYFVTAVIISFLPFVRSEGWLMMGLFAFYFIIVKQYKMLPVLLIGHAVYSLAGFFYYKDLFWIFTANPYSSLNSIYGHGELLHFVRQLFYVVGIPLYFLLACGIFYFLFAFFRKQNRTSFFKEELILIYGSFFVFFIAHTLFWYLGIFGSGGLNRVLISVMPLTAIIGLRGINFISFEEKIKNKIIPITLKAVLIIYVLVFPFTPNHAALHLENDFSLAPDQLLSNDFAATIKEIYPEKKYYYEYTYFSESFGIDPFDKNLHDNIGSLEKLCNIPSKSVIIWDDWYAPVQAGVKLDDLRNDTINFSEKISIKKDSTQFVVFLKK